MARANQSRHEYAHLHACFRDPQADNPVAAGLEKLASTGPEGVDRRAALARALKLKDYEFNAQGVELNQRYCSANIIPDTDAGPEQWQQDRELFAQSTTRPGAKLPHVWLVGADGRRTSTLDLVGKGRFTLITGLAGTPWQRAAEHLALPFLRTVVIGSPEAQDLYCYWQAAREIDEDGALLVRPDGIVAWRSRRAMPDSVSGLTWALGVSLSLPEANLHALRNVTLP